MSDDKTCFVAMPVTTPASHRDNFGDPNHFAHVLDHLFEPALASNGYTVIPPIVVGSELIHAEIVRNLEEADLVLCDLSGLNPNVFFELGIRTSLDREVVLVKDDLTPQIPFDLSAINIMTYDGSLTPWTLVREIPRLSAHVADATKSGLGGNAMWRHFGLTSRASPAEIAENPIEAKIDLLLQEVSNLQISAMHQEAQPAASTNAEIYASVEQLAAEIIASSDLLTAEVVYASGGYIKIALRATEGQAVPMSLIRQLRYLEKISGMHFDIRRNSFPQVIPESTGKALCVDASPAKN